MVTTDRVLDALPANVAVLDADGKIVSVNAGWRRFGTSSEPPDRASTVGKNYLEICAQATGADALDARIAADGIRSVLTARRDSFSMEYPCDVLSERRWFRMIVTPLPREHGTGAIVMHVDITGSQEGAHTLREAERSARESEQRLSFALAAADIGDWSLDLRTNEAHRSLRHDQCFGYTELLPSWTYDTFLAHVDAVDRTQVDACFKSAMAGHGEYDTEFRSTWADGSLHWLWTRGRFYFNDAGAPIRVAGIVTDITERKRITEALRASEAAAERAVHRLNEAQHVGRMGDWDFDIATGAVAWSPAVFELLNRDPALGPPASLEDVVALFEADGAARHQANVEQAIATGNTQQYELSTVRSDDTRAYFDVVAVPRKDATGAVVSLYGTVQDITARKEAEAQLLESEHRLELATKSAQMGIWDWNLERNTLVWDARMYELFAASPLDAAQPWEIYRQRVVPEDLDRMDAEAAAVMADQQTYHSEFRVVWPDGDVRYLETHATVHRSGDGVALRMIGLNWDITDRKRAEIASMRLADIVASSDDAIIGKNVQGIISSWNRGAVKIFGYSAEEMVGTPMLRLLPADRLEEEAVILDRVQRGESIEHFETVRQTKDGRMIDVSITASPIFDATGAVAGVSHVARDISERKKLEKQFLRAQRMESIGTLAGGIAHDLNNALAPIILSIDLLKMSFLDDESQELLATINASALHGADMVRQLLSFARGIDGKRLPVHMPKLLTDIARITSDTFLKHIQIKAHVADDLWGVIGDATQLHQVLMNLCVNARDAMPSGGVLSISAENITIDGHYAGLNAESRQGPYVLIQVEDTGTGMSAGVIEKIFDPFFTTKEVGTGTGLGLSTTMAIVKSHGGFMRVYSEPGRGTKFQVFLPAMGGVTSRDVEVVEELPRGHGELVLVVDDEPSVRQITRHTLEAFGYRVLLASDGADAVAMYAANRPEIAVVLTDMMMPVMDGVAMIRVLKRMNPDVRIVAASGLTGNAPGMTPGNLGVTHFLAKPYTAESLLHVLREILAAE